MSLIPVILNWPLALLPVHILFLELIIDPACTIVFEGESDEKDIMVRPPRRLNEPLFGRTMVLTGLIQGIGVLAAVFAVFTVGMLSDWGETGARMAAFVTLVIGNLGLIFTNRSWTQSIFAYLRVPNPALWWITGGTAFFLLLILFVPFLRDVFLFAPVQWNEIFFIAVACIISLAIAESVKMKWIQKIITPA
jgi:P-type Ca2+ transporter type 2C